MPEKFNQPNETPESNHTPELESKTREEKMQDRIWQRPSDEEVEALSPNVKKYVERAGGTTEYTPAAAITGYTRFLDLTELTKTRRLIDLGSAGNTINHHASLLALEQSGINEYIGVDAYSEKGGNLEARKSAEEAGYPHASPEEPELKDRIKVQSIRKEILEALHSMPDDYGNVWTMGLDSITFNLPTDWKIAALAEMKRVVPEGGIIFTDGMYLDGALAECSSEFAQARRMMKKIKERWQTPDQNHEEAIAFLSKYECPPDDPYHNLTTIKDYDPEEEKESNFSNPGMKYCVDLPEIGFRVYFDKMKSSIDPMFIVNAQKTRT